MVLAAVKQEVNPTVSSSTTTKIVLVVEYDGTRYNGFQLQADQPTIQGELEKALEKLTGEKLRLLAASRTDTGVHARGQVVSFRTKSSLPVETFITGMNYYLPKDIAVKAAHRVRDSFNVQRRAVSREYQYYILNSPTRSPLMRDFAYLVPQPLDVAVMNEACQALLGEHDFVSFASSLGARIKNTVRRVYRAEVKREGKLVIFTIVASSFLPHQVRHTLGSLIRVGLGRMSLSEFCSIMEAKKPGLAAPAAPACGLCLIRVDYPRPLEEELL